MATDLTNAVPFAGGEVFNPADFVRVTNRDPESTIRVRGKVIQAIQGRYNGRDYVFPFGQPVNVQLDVARHIFAIGSDDKVTALARLGWMRTSEQTDEAFQRLLKISFEDLPELMEASRFKSNAIAHASGLVKSDGTEGAPPGAPDDPPKKSEVTGNVITNTQGSTGIDFTPSESKTLHLPPKGKA